MKTERKVANDGYTEVTVYCDGPHDLPEWATEVDLYKDFAYLDDEYLGEKSHHELFSDASFDYYNDIGRVTIFKLEKSDIWFARDREKVSVAERTLEDLAEAQTRMIESDEWIGTISGGVFIIGGLLFLLGVPWKVLALAAALILVPVLIRDEMIKMRFNRLAAKAPAARKAAGKWDWQ